MGQSLVPHRSGQRVPGSIVDNPKIKKRLTLIQKPGK